MIQNKGFYYHSAGLEPYRDAFGRSYVPEHKRNTSCDLILADSYNA